MFKPKTVLFFLCAVLCWGSAFAFDLPAELAKAKPGTVVQVPAGTYPLSVQIPAGVTLRGAGYANTTLDARNAMTGVTMKAAKGARVENLTVLNSGTGIAVDGSDNVVISGVMIVGGTIGVSASNAGGVRVENCVISKALIGITAMAVRNATIANNTVYTADSAALCISNASDSAVFNNLVANAGTGVVVGGANHNLAVDYNNYIALVTGKIEGQLQRPTVPTWRDASGGLDAHSVQLNVDFANPDHQDFHPVSTLSWSPARVSTSGWGIATLAGHAAPTMDMDGAMHAGSYGLGAFEAPGLPGHTADGSFTISSDNGEKSAGLFTADNTLVCYLFNGLPLKKGTYPYVLPARDCFGRPIPAGKYELRVVESPVKWVYHGMSANNGKGNTIDVADTIHVGRMLFMPDGQLLTSSGWSEKHINLRLGDAAMNTPKWVFYGSADCPGLCLDSHGNILLMRNANQGVDLFTINPGTGSPLVRADGTYFANIKDSFKSGYIGGMAELNGKLYVADIDADKLVIGNLDTLKFDTVVAMPTPLSPAVDRKHHLIWIISNREKILALDADGKTVQTFTEVPNPLSISVAGDHLAVASAKTGKIHIFDITDPAAPKLLRTIGRGDGPYGNWLPDRFQFQGHPLNTNSIYSSIALAENGAIAVRDASGRIVTFDPDGKLLHDGFAVWGGDPLLVRLAGDHRLRGFDSNGSQSYFLDEKAGTWTPDTYWGLPQMKGLQPHGFFTAGGHNFGVFTCDNPDLANDMAVMIASYDQPVVRPLLLYKHKANGQYLVCRDTNGDGVIDAKDEPGIVVMDTDGRPITFGLAGRFMFVNADGTIMHSDYKLAVRWRLQGLDAHGVPQYVFDRQSIFQAKNPEVPSPYYLAKSENLNCTTTAKFAADGGLCACINLHNTPNGTGFSNSGATDMARWNPDGSLRWLHTLNDYTPVQGVMPFPDVVVSSWGHQAEFMVLDDDGMELMRGGFLPASNWNGFWVDHPQEWMAQRTDDGNIQVVIGDYMANCHHWFSIQGIGGVRKTRFPVTILPVKARELAYHAPQLHESVGQATSPAITIKRLQNPLPIDGDMQKWRTLNLAPQVLLTPQNGYGKINGPLDLSGLVRLAYQGHDLYAQVIVFDNFVTFHQPASRFYMTDSLQFTINSYLTGFGFNVAQTIDKGALFCRGRFYLSEFDLDLDPVKAPRIVKKFDNARDIPERQYIESIYGVDMANSSGYVIEFKLPLDAYSYQKDEKSVPKVEPGSWFWIGFMINDNDNPGTDVQNYIAWPGSFGIFTTEEKGAKAFFE